MNQIFRIMGLERATIQPTRVSLSVYEPNQKRATIQPMRVSLSVYEPDLPDHGPERSHDSRCHQVGDQMTRAARGRQ
jgi:hypothetical protein